LLISEATTISAQTNGWNESPGIYTEEMRDAWKQVTDAVHAKETPIFLQLWHMGRASHSSFHNGELPHALTTDEIALVIKDYQRAAQYAKEAGFDGV
jgi:2,4-dienoyl-CoA reductase-like NADH-dependent reductase (Old Yellow Enzyme family)